MPGRRRSKNSAASLAYGAGHLTSRFGVGRAAIRTAAPLALDDFAAQILAKRFEGLGDDAFGVETCARIHSARRILVDEQVGQHHRANFEATIKHAVLGERLQHK